MTGNSVDSDQTALAVWLEPYLCASILTLSVLLKAIICISRLQQTTFLMHFLGFKFAAWNTYKPCACTCILYHSVVHLLFAPPPPPPCTNENINVSLYKALILEKPSRASMAVFLWSQNGVRRCLACASGLRRSHDWGWVVSYCNWAKMAQKYLLCRTAKQASSLQRLGWNSARSATWSKSIECPAGYRLQPAYARGR